MIKDIQNILLEAWDKIVFRLKYPKYVYTSHPYAHFALLKDDKVHYKGKDLFRLVALIDFSDIKAGDLGGYVENRYNLDFRYKCDPWVYDNARVGGSARITSNAKIKDSAIVWGPVEVQGSTVISGEQRLVKPPRVIFKADIEDNWWHQ